MDSFNFSIALPVRSDWANVDLLRTSEQNCVTAICCVIVGCRSLAMVTGELIENAIKYGDWSRTEDHRFHLRVWGEGRSAHVSVENPVNGDAHADAVLETLGWMRRFASPGDAKHTKQHKDTTTEREPGNSKLGLVRIAYEGNCILTAEIARGMLRVQAELTV